MITTMLSTTTILHGHNGRQAKVLNLTNCLSLQECDSFTPLQDKTYLSGLSSPVFTPLMELMI